MEDPYLSLNQWFDTDAGYAVITAIDEKLKPILNQLRGQHLLQLGVASRFWHYNFFRFQHIHVLGTSLHANDASCIAEQEQLPIADESIDCIIAPFSLELTRNKARLISELDRVLNPMGYLIVIGVNPWGLWGKLNLRPANPFHGKVKALLSAVNLRHRLVKLGYNVQMIDNFYYPPPVKSFRWHSRLSLLNEIGKILWPLPAGFYFLLAQKFQLNMLTPDRVEQAELNFSSRKVSPV